ncbi:bifunctional phosphopantothenoylcysteine decarboxylase/phosphopantothenate--cysteine ligase CoaBC, partial [Sphingorhabdus sp.]|uniref:bifunctional phosphopantothenoylcysteine decarboxylase/phosphopantothenate--cysteine ligase CoaBC n=3 Tax=Sphingorhabdus sp. TaxID=1902408 RepID=UPI003C764167
QKRILLIIGGGIAAYKSAELIRTIRKAGHAVRCVMTKGGAQFVTPLTLGALSEDKVYTDLFDLKDEAEMGHIQLSRQADLVVVCPATADLLAKMHAGIADDLATTLLLATDKPVLVVPAMNVRMWQHPATRRNVSALRADGIRVIDPDEGEMACGEFGPGRLPEIERIFAEIAHQLAVEHVTMTAQPDFSEPPHRPLYGKRVLVTAGPTHEPIDPVRYIANRSSGRQGFAIAQAAAELGAQVTLVSGPVNLVTPPGVIRIDIESAREMLTEVEKALPADVAIMVAAVADWHVADVPEQKIKKDGNAIPPLTLSENPDILATLAKHKQRPGLLIGFAAETEKIVEHAQAKLAKKGCDWIVANDVSGDVMGGANNAFHIITKNGVESWPDSPKDVIARKLMEKVADVVSKG